VDGAFHRTPTPLDDDSSALAFVFFALWMTPARPSPLRFWWGLIMVDMGDMSWLLVLVIKVRYDIYASYFPVKSKADCPIAMYGMYVAPRKHVCTYKYGR
jgi:hypothetical protein